MTHTTAGRVRVRVAGLQPAQVLAGLVGLLLIVAGVAGVLRTGFGEMTGHDHSMLFGFAVNPLHNVVHLAIGVLGLLMASSSGLARTYGWLFFLGYGAVFVWGLMIEGIVSRNPVSGAGNPLNLNAADNWLHLGFAAVGLLIAVAPARRKIVPIEEPAVEAVPEPEHREMSAPRLEEQRVERAGRRDTTAEDTVIGEPMTESERAEHGQRQWRKV
jgi:hypothetical protein